MKRRSLLISLAALLARPALGDLQPESQQLSQELLQALRHAKAITIYSLEPDNQPGGWESCTVLGSAQLTPEEMKIATQILAQGLLTGSQIARCFIPHHGLRVVLARETYHAIICVTCHNIKIRRLSDGAISDCIPFAADGERLNALLAAHKLPIPEELP